MYRKISGFRVLKLFLYSILLFMGGMMIPIFFAFIPAMYLSEMRRQGVAPIAAVFIGVCVILGFLTDPMTGLAILTVMGPLILILDYCMRTDKSVEMTMSVGTILFIVSLSFVLYQSGILEAIQTGEFLKQIDAMQQEVVKNANLTSVDAARIGVSLKTMVRQAMEVFPAFILLSSLATTYLSYRISGRNMRIDGEKVICPGPFFLLRLPKIPTLVSALIVAVGFLLEAMLSPGIDIYLANGLVILIGVLSVQGLSIVNFYLLQFIPKSPILRGMLMFFSLTIPIGQMALAALGLIDQLLNVRGIEGA